jgi:hypothetical protein
VAKLQRGDGSFDMGTGCTSGKMFVGALGGLEFVGAGGGKKSPWL